MENFAEKLRTARKMAGLTMRGLANATENKLTQQSISRYENGIMKPTPDNLLVLTKALKVKPEFFLRTNNSNIKNVAFRKIKRLPKKEEIRIEYLTIDFLESLVELEELTGDTTKFENPIKNLEIDTIDDVEKAAKKVREEWHLGLNPIHSAVTTLENNHVDILGINSHAAFSGMASEPSSPYNFMVINLNEEIKIDRQRFTLMHEFGHMILPIEHLGDKEKEKFAHRFSGALLIPENKMKEIFGTNRRNLGLHEVLAVKKEYGVSVQALIYRAKDLGIINPFTFQNLMKTISRMGWRREEPQPFKGEEIPIRLFRIISRAISEEVITTSKAASLLNVSLDELNNRLMNFTYQ